MAEIDEDTRVTVPEEVALTPLDLGAQPATDRGYMTANGTKLRARIVQIESVLPAAPIPTNTPVQISPSGYSLSVTLALLADDLSVAEDSLGRLMIMERHELVISDEAMQNPGFDAQVAVETLLRQEAFRLEQRVKQRAATADYLAAHWGHRSNASDTPLPAGEMA